MQKLMIVLMVLGISTTVLATEYDCKSIDPTHYPTYRIFVEELASGKFVLLGSKLTTEDFQTYTQSSFWHVAEKKTSIEGTTVFMWDEVSDDNKVGMLEIKELGNNFLKGSIVFENQTSPYAIELSCK